MSTQLYKEHHYHYFLDNRFFFSFRKCHIGAPLCGWGGSSIIRFGTNFMWNLSTHRKSTGLMKSMIWLYLVPYTIKRAIPLLPVSCPRPRRAGLSPHHLIKNHNCKNAANFRKLISIYIKEEPLGLLKNIVTTMHYYALSLNSQEKAILLKFS